MLATWISRWQQRYQAPKPVWADIALFRSLNMAYHASVLPAGTDITFYDVGRLASLWSALSKSLFIPEAMVG